MAAPKLIETKPQPNFPYEDLSDNNAFYLGLLLSNERCLRTGHRTAEFMHPIFTGTHRPLIAASSNVFSEASQVRCVDYGIQAFEAITAWVNADRLTADLEVLKVNIPQIINPAHTNAVRGYFEESWAEFHDQTPRTAAVIAESAESYRLQPNLAVLGGAIARMFELNNTEDPKL